MFLLQPTNNTFTRHFAQDMSLIDQTIATMSGRLFDHYEIYKKDISGYMFQSSLINKEIVDFIQKFYKKTKIYIYFDQMNMELYQNASTVIRCIVREDMMGSDTSVFKNKNTIKANIMYSEMLLNSAGLDDENQTNNDIIGDISDIKQLPKILSDVLYPNSTQFRIKLFNSTSINVAQNLGFLDDIEMISEINRCKIYLDTNLNYLVYAAILDKPIIALETNGVVKKIKEITLETIEHPDKSKIPIQDLIKNSYKNFINKYIL